MMQTLRPFVRNKSNEQALCMLKGMPADCKKLLLVGPSGSGKTTLLRHHVFDNNKAIPDSALFCSGVEIYAAIFIRENETFLDKLAKVPLLVIDDIDLLLEKEQGDETLSLLINTRDELGLCSIASSHLPLETLYALSSRSILKNFKVCHIDLLDADGRRDYASALSCHYSTSSSPTLTSDAIDVMASLFEELDDINTSMHYLMTASDFKSNYVINGESIKKLFA